MTEHLKPVPTYQGKQWLINGWNLFKKKPLTWVFMLLIFDIFMIVSSNFFIGKFIAALFMPVLAGGVFIAFDNMSRDETIGLENLFSVFNNKPILKELITVGIIGVAMVALTLVLLYLTGTEYEVKVAGTTDVYETETKGSVYTSIVSFFWPCALIFSIPLVAINKVNAIPALKQSLQGLVLNIVPMFIFAVMIFLLAIVSILPVGLGLLVLIPVLFGAVYTGFKEIYAETDVHNFSETTAKQDFAEMFEKPNISEVVTEKIKTKHEEEEQPVRDINNNKHQEADLKKAYQSIRTYSWVGIALIAAGIMLTAYSYYSLQSGTNTMGEVVSVEIQESRRNSGGTSTTYKPMFSFADEQGELREASTRTSSSEYNYPVGSRVKINYNSSDYSTVQINSVSSIIFFPMLFWLLGGAFVWITKSAKKNIDKNGVAPRKSMFLKEDSETANFQNDQQNNTKSVPELEMPKKITLETYDDYMHMIISWFGIKTIAATLMAIVTIGASYILFFADSSNVAISASPLMIKLFPWISAISGAGILYFMLTTWFNKTHIIVSQNTIEIQHKPLPWFGNKKLETKNIKQLYVKEWMSTSTSSHRKSSYYLHVISIDEDDITLMKLEKKEQAYFIEQQIEKYLGIKNLKVREWID